MNTVPTHDKHTRNKHFSHNKHTFSSEQKFAYFGKGRILEKFIACIFSTLSRLRLIFYYFWKNV